MKKKTGPFHGSPSRHLHVAVLGGGLIKDKEKGWRTTTFEESDTFGVLGDRLRVLAGAELVARNPRSKLIAVGGKGQLARVSGAVPVAEVIKKELIAEGVPSSRVTLLPEGNTTFEQLRCLQDFTKQHGIESISLLSNRYHLPRIRAMIKFLPEFSGWKNTTLLSAEDLLISFNEEKWGACIAQAYRNPPMKERIKKERAGAQNLRKGHYEF